MFAFFSDDPSSIPALKSTYFCKKIAVEKSKRSRGLRFLKVCLFSVTHLTILTQLKARHYYHRVYCQLFLLSVESLLGGMLLKKSFFNQTSIQFLQQIDVKNVHQVFGAGIQTHNLQNMCLLP